MANRNQAHVRALKVGEQVRAPAATVLPEPRAPREGCDTTTNEAESVRSPAASRQTATRWVDRRQLGRLIHRRRWYAFQKTHIRSAADLSWRAYTSLELPIVDFLCLAVLSAVRGREWQMTFSKPSSKEDGIHRNEPDGGRAGIKLDSSLESVGSNVRNAFINNRKISTAS